MGQDSISISDFLDQSKFQESVIFQNKKINHLKDISGKMPIVEKLEFRTETNDFDIRKQEYLLRVSPNSIKNIKTQGQYRETVLHMANMEMELEWSKAIRDRYQILIDYIHNKKILLAKRKQQILFNDKLTLMKRSITLKDFDILDLIEAEDEQLENQRTILDLQNSIQTIQNTIDRMNNSSFPIKLEDEQLLEVGDIKAMINEPMQGALAKHTELEVLSARFYSYMLEYEWEDAKSKFSLGYIQTKYGYDPNDNFKKSFSIGVGFDIPLKNPAHLKLSELEIKILASESQYRNAKNQLIDNIFKLQQQLNNLIKKYELIDQHLNTSIAEFALNKFSELTEASPKAMLKLRENTLRKELLLEELEMEIFKTFIEYLDKTGLLTQRPFKNYLSKALVEF